MRLTSILQSPHKVIILYLWLVLFLMILLFCVGGITRLTYSGLSMTDWKPITGILPPLSQQSWEQSFEEYQKFPEYQQLFLSMDLSDYKKNLFLGISASYLSSFSRVYFCNTSSLVFNT